MPKIFGPLIMDLMGKTVSPEERELIAHPLVGGLILFTRNYESKAQIKNLIHEIRRIKDKPLLIMVDQEGGRVQRFKDAEFLRLPPAAHYGKVFDQDAKLGLLLAQTGGLLMAQELMSLGIDLSLAPILDIDKNLSSIIGDRAFHADTDKASALAAAFIAGMNQTGMNATGKHFPGHGSVTLDSHLALPIDTRLFAEIEAQDLKPFKALIEQNIPALMTAHILFPEVDAQPVSFSSYWLKTILRERLGFKGVVMSDDLDMKGAHLVGDFADRMRAACEAGCDIIFFCNNRPAVIQVLDKLPSQAYMLELDMYESLCGNFGLAQKIDRAQIQKHQAFFAQHSPQTLVEN